MVHYGLEAASTAKKFTWIGTTMAWFFILLVIRIDHLKNIFRTNFREISFYRKEYNNALDRHLVDVIDSWKWNFIINMGPPWQLLLHNFFDLWSKKMRFITKVVSIVHAILAFAVNFTRLHYEVGQAAYPSLNFKYSTTK